MTQRSSGDRSNQLGGQEKGMPWSARAGRPASGALASPPTKPGEPPAIPQQYECGPVHFSGDENASFERHLVFDHALDPRLASDRERFEALARSLRDLLTQRWLKTQQTHDRENPKCVYYISMEFLLGRSLTDNITNLLVDPLVQDVLEHEGLDLTRLAVTEPDAGLGNGGLGRLAACFIDSLATPQIPAIGYGLRYEYGIFRQEIKDGNQVESPDNWLRRPDPWEVMPARRGRGGQGQWQPAIP